MSRPRVAVFQAHWPLQVHTTNIVKELTRRGYAVDLFAYGLPQDFETLDPAAFDGDVRVLDLTPRATPSSAPRSESSGRSSVKRALSDMARRVPHARRIVRAARAVRAYAPLDLIEYGLRIHDLNYILPPWLLDATEDRMGSSDYKLFLGVERQGLLWAGEMARRRGVASAYYSLELYTNDSPHFRGRAFRRLKRLEREYHAECRATITQDELRAKVLFEDNHVMPTTVHYVPVSLLGDPRPGKTRYLHRKLGLSDDSRVILVLGQVHGERFTREAVTAAQQFPDDWALVVHGPAYEDVRFLEELQRLNHAGRARFSTDLVPQNELGDLVASADVGVALYSSATLNETLTGRSSEKLARYAQAGVPMIAFDYPSYGDVFERYHCGRLISQVADMPREVRAIFDDYDAFRAGALRAYDEVYEFSKPFSRVIDWIDQL